MNEGTARRKAALWVAAVFLFAAALGGVLGFMFARHPVLANAPKSEQERRAHRVEELSRELALTDQQQQQLDGILSQLHAEYKTLHEQSDAQIEQARRRGRDEIRAILTPEQKPKFEEFLKRKDEERKRTPPPPPPR